MCDAMRPRVGEYHGLTPTPKCNYYDEKVDCVTIGYSIIGDP